MRLQEGGLVHGVALVGHAWGWLGAGGHLGRRMHGDLVHLLLVGGVQDDGGGVVGRHEVGVRAKLRMKND